MFCGYALRVSLDHDWEGIIPSRPASSLPNILNGLLVGQ